MKKGFYILVVMFFIFPVYLFSQNEGVIHIDTTLVEESAVDTAVA